MRFQFVIVLFLTTVVADCSYGQIRRWDTGEVIPGTEGITLGPGVNLSNWNTSLRNLRYADLSGIDLSGARFAASDLTGSRLSGLDVSTDISDSRIEWATFSGLSSEQLYSTASYRDRSLIGVSFQKMDLSNWDLTGQNLMWSQFASFSRGITWHNVSIEAASFKYSSFGRVSGEPGWDSDTVMNQWTSKIVLGGHLLGIDTGLPFTLETSLQGDFNDDDAMTLADIDFLRARVQHNRFLHDSFTSWYHPALDFHEDSKIDFLDLDAFVHNTFNTWMGDANGDGQFTSSDLVSVLAAGEYVDSLLDNSTWMSGDWDADGEFTSSDLVLAFQDGGYEAGPRAVPVPEPSSAAHFSLTGMTAALWLIRHVSSKRGIE